MSSLSGRVALWILIGGGGITLFGCTQWVAGLTYRIAAAHEASTVGQIVKVAEGPKHTIYTYEFRVNGVKVSDSSESCHTPLTPAACITGGPALVYFSDEPFSISLLEDFAEASRHTINRANWALSIGLPLIGILGVLSWLDKRRGETDPSENSDEDSQDDEPEVLSIAPRN